MKKKYMLMAVLFITVGFAAMATTLIINGNIRIASLVEDFDVYFSSAIIDGIDKSNLLISDDKRNLEFETKELKKIDDSSTLEFEVTNNSTQYDAHVEITCNVDDDEYITLTKDKEFYDIPAQTRESGTLTITLTGLVTENVNSTIECSLNSDAVERTDVMENAIYDPTYQITGTLQDENGNPLEMKKLVVYSETPHYVETDNFGFFYVGGLEKGQHEIYFLDDIENVESLSKSEVASIAKDEAVITTSDKNIEFEEIELENFVVEPDKNGDVSVEFDTNGGTLEDSQQVVSLYSRLGDIPKPTKPNSTFKYWTYNGKEVTEDTIINEPKKLKAMWKYSIILEGSNFTYEPAEGNQIDDLEPGDSRNIVINPEDGYYFESMSCNTGYTNTLVTGVSSISSQTISVSNNNVYENGKCTVIMAETCPYSPGESWSFTGASNFVVPCKGTYNLVANGAKGSDSSLTMRDRSGSGSYKTKGVNGGFATGNISLAKNDSLGIVTYAGGSSKSISSSQKCDLSSSYGGGTCTLSMSGSTGAGGNGFGVTYNGSTVLAAGGGAGGDSNNGISTNGCTTIPLSNGSISPRTTNDVKTSTTSGVAGASISKTISSRTVSFGYGGGGGGYPYGGGNSGGNTYSGGCYCNGLTDCSTSYGKSTTGSVVITLLSIG